MSAPSPTVRPVADASRIAAEGRRAQRIAFVIMAIVLLIRPQGLFGRRG